jgi:hypothetical protein
VDNEKGRDFRQNRHLLPPLERKQRKGRGGADRWWAAALPGTAAAGKWVNGERGGRGRPISILTSGWDGLWKEIDSSGDLQQRRYMWRWWGAQEGEGGGWCGLGVRQVRHKPLLLAREGSEAAEVGHAKLVQPVNGGRAGGICAGVIAALRPCCWMRLVGQRRGGRRAGRHVVA